MIRASAFPRNHRIGANDPGLRPDQADRGGLGFGKGQRQFEILALVGGLNGGFVDLRSDGLETQSRLVEHGPANGARGSKDQRHAKGITLWISPCAVLARKWGQAKPLDWRATARLPSRFRPQGGRNAVPV